MKIRLNEKQWYKKAGNSGNGYMATNERCAAIFTTAGEAQEILKELKKLYRYENADAVIIGTVS